MRYEFYLNPRENFPQDFENNEPYSEIYGNINTAKIWAKHLLFCNNAVSIDFRSSNGRKLYNIDRKTVRVKYFGNVEEQ